MHCTQRPSSTVKNCACEKSSPFFSAAACFAHSNMSGVTNSGRRMQLIHSNSLLREGPNTPPGSFQNPSKGGTTYSKYPSRACPAFGDILIVNEMP